MNRITGASQMTLPPDLANIVSAYIPDTALSLPFEQQRHIVREITGYLPSNPDVVLRYLQNPILSILAEDEAVLPHIQEKIANEIGIFIWDQRTVVEYLDRLPDHDGLEIVARDPGTWDQLQCKVGDESFQELLLKAGTQETMVEYYEISGQSEGDLTYEQIRTRFVGILYHRDWEYLNEFVLQQGAGPALSHYETDVDRTEINRYTPEEVALLVQAELSGSIGLDLTFVMLPAYIINQDVDRFLHYMSMYPDEKHSGMLGELLILADVAIDLDNPVFPAYMEAYPDSDVAVAFKKGGVDAFIQLHYPPTEVW